MRKLRILINNALPFVGVVLILGAVLILREDLRIQVAVVGLGMLLIEMGVWRFGDKVLPSERKNLALRAETDRFIDLVRALNAAALAVKAHDSPETRQAFQHVQETMQQAIGRMAEVAGKTDAELASERDVLAYHPPA
ncbi:MAG: hypothetical protein R3268_10560 [Acidiferrobacterales bacterium]|nr:hypothetical protein [Acidiferrobacterales bacterium]